MEREPFKFKASFAQEALGLGIFMVAACLGAALLEAPASAVHRALGDPLARRLIMGCIMGLTAVCLIYSPMGRNSGAHYNPAVTLSFWRLKKIGGRDAAAYIVAQCVGGTLGVYAAWGLLGAALAAPQVDFIVTVPGPAGAGVAFATEFLETFVLMSAILLTQRSEAGRRYTGLVAGCILALEVGLFSPLSGASLNPARTLASALPAGDFRSWWIYASAPLLGMLGAAELQQRFFRQVPHAAGL